MTRDQQDSNRLLQGHIVFVFFSMPGLCLLVFYVLLVLFSVLAAICILLLQTIEKCFSKEVHWLITNNKSHLEAIRNSTTSPSNLSPANLSPSPFNTGALNSPQADSPSGTGRSGGSKPVSHVTNHFLLNSLRKIKLFLCDDK